jgi:acyl carrier protein
MPDSLPLRLKRLIVDTLKLEDVAPDQIPDDEPLIGAGLDLDSIDALELVVCLEREFGVKIRNSEETRAAFSSVSGLAAYVRAHASAEKRPA